jgi:hypothetical protein
LKDGFVRSAAAVALVRAYLTSKSGCRILSLRLLIGLILSKLDQGNATLGRSTNAKHILAPRRMERNWSLAPKYEVLRSLAILKLIMVQKRKSVPLQFS